LHVIDCRQDRIGCALRGEDPMAMASLPSGFAVIGDIQHLPGYLLLIGRDATINHLTDLDHARMAVTELAGRTTQRCWVAPAKNASSCFLACASSPGIRCP
jgi:hypothetical protein